MEQLSPDAVEALAVSLSAKLGVALATQEQDRIEDDKFKKEVRAALTDIRRSTNTLTMVAVGLSVLALIASVVGITRTRGAERLSESKPCEAMVVSSVRRSN